MNVGIIVASMPALRQLLAVFHQYDRRGSRMPELSPQRNRMPKMDAPQLNDGCNRAQSSEKSDESIDKGSNGQGPENGITVPRRTSMAPRVAGLGSAVRSSQEGKLEQDLLHYEDEKMSPRETPWATPRVSPRMGSFVGPPWLEHEE